MLPRLYVAAIGRGPMNKGSIVVAVLQQSDRLEPRYKLSTLLNFTFTLAVAWLVCSCLRWQHKPKCKKTYVDNSSSRFDNLQHYGNYLTRHNGVNIICASRSATMWHHCKACIGM